MKILISNSPLHFTHGHTFTQADWQTLVLPLLAGIIGDRHDLRIVDNNFLNLSSNTILKDIKTFEPEVVAFSIIAARDIFNTIEIIKKVREAFPDLILLAGGQGASFYDEMLLKEGVNFVARGEAELTLKELIQTIEEKSDSFSQIKGISYSDHGNLVRTEDRPKIKDLDDSPFPAYHLMPPRKSMWFPGRLTGSIETSRGCPFTCSFCAITSFWDRSYRRKSNERLIEEMKILVKQGRSHFYFADDNFGMGEDAHADLFEGILKAGLDVKFFAQMRTDTIGMHPELIALGAKAGLYGALIGFDTYDKSTFHHIAKVGSIDLNEKCVEVLRKNKIMIFGSHIYGLPNQKDPAEFFKTFWVGRKNSDLFRMPHFSLLPGTKDYEKMINEKIIEGNQGKDDNRLMVRSPEEQKRFKRWYMFFNLLHIFLADEMFKTFFHPNRTVRRIKQRGYIGVFRHYSYKFLRKFKLCDI